MTIPFWSVPQGDVLRRLDSSSDGLTGAVAERRLGEVGPNRLHDRPRAKTAWLLVRQFASPIVLLLIGAALLSWLVHDSTDARVILGIVIASGLLGFWQEHDAANTVDKLLAVVELKTTVIRDGQPVRMAIESVVPGDVVELSAGSGIPADCRVLSSHDLFVNGSWGLRWAAILYGIGLALTFDEFGLWLHLGGSYWQRASFDAVVVIAGLLGLVMVAPSMSRFRPHHWVTAAMLAGTVAVFGYLLVDSLQYADRLLLRIQIIEQSQPPRR